MPRAAAALDPIPVVPALPKAGGPRPRQARSVATRERLLAAAIETFVEQGYAALTTTEVCRRAQLSQGALFKHFASKAGLVGAMAERLFAALIEDFRAGFARTAGAADELGAALRALVRTFGEPRLLAALELYTAARTDPVLRAQLAPVLARHHANLLREARELFPRAAAANPDFEAIVDGVIATLQGGALGGLVLQDAAAAGRTLAWLERRVRRELAE
jgi:AcrR family transcriptional regulator